MVYPSVRMANRAAAVHGLEAPTTAATCAPPLALGWGAVSASAGANRTRRPAGSPRRLKRVALIAIGVLLFLVVSALLARLLTPDNLEQEKDLALIQAEVRGDAASMVDQLQGCSKSAACLASVRQNASDRRLRRSGAVKILSLTAATANAPNGATGSTRLAWTVIGTQPVVQCVDVRRTGNAVTGIKVALLTLSAPISNEADC
jgi:hypothetical protein